MKKGFRINMFDLIINFNIFSHIYSFIIKQKRTLVYLEEDYFDNMIVKKQQEVYKKNINKAVVNFLLYILTKKNQKFSY